MTMRRYYHLPSILAVAISHKNVALAFNSRACATSAGIQRPPSNAASAAALSVAMADSHVDAGVDDVATSASIRPDTDGTHNELALLLPGQTLRIQIGDVSASRKAWKKRRRNASPILVPCSVLGVNREWMVRWNVVTLLHAIGEVSGDAGGAVSTTAGKLGRAYRQRLGGDLRDHAAALGHASADALLRALFDDAIRAEYGVRTFVEPLHGNLVLATCVSRRQARQFSAAAGLVQFRPDDAGGDGAYRMLHTGLAAVPRESRAGRLPRLAEEPLGAALRVSPLDQAAERYRPGDELNAFVYSYNARGDNELPLLVLTTDDPRGKGAAVGSGTFGSFTRVFKRRTMEGAGGDLAEEAGIERGLTDLSTGDGPFAATVVAVSSHSSAAFVDCGVGRKRGKRLGGGVKKVLGMLRFEDLCREDAAAAPGDAADVKAGDKVQVYIKAVSPQSGRFMVTLDPSVKDTKPKDLKRAQRADKRQERLAKKWGAEDVRALVGTVRDGTVKARSKTGDWYYVQPEGGGSGARDGPALPVGVARAEGGGGPYAAGERVRVRVEGVERGQLALTLLE